MDRKIIVLIIVTIGIIAVIGMSMFMSKDKKQEDNILETKVKKFSVKYSGTEIVPGTEFKEDKITKTVEISEIPSCGFSGTDKVYTYNNIEITVSNIDGIDRVYEVYFIDETVTTNEGVKITDSKDLMIEKYGNDYKKTLENSYTYTRNNVELTFTIENDVITGITYILVV